MQRKFNNILASGGRFASVVFMLAMLLGSAGMADAQQGMIRGTVLDQLTGNPLHGAEIRLGDSGQNVVSDGDGRFMLRRIPAGTHTLVIRYSGYEMKEIEVRVQAGIALEQIIGLTPDFLEGDRIFVESGQQGMHRSLARQKTSESFMETIDTEQLWRTADYSVEDALMRLPGMQLGSRGELNVRGVGYNRFYVTMDGQRLGTTGLGDRTYDLGGMSSNLVQDVEVIKVLTPDRYADGLGGAVNLVTRPALGGQRSLNVQVGGGGTPRYFKYHGVAGNAAVRFYDSPRDDFSIAVNLTYQTDHRPSEMLGLEYGLADFGAGSVDAIQRISPSVYTDEASRLGASIHMNFQPNERDRFFLQGMMNLNQRDVQRHRNYWSSGGDWKTPDSTGLAGSSGSYGYELSMTDISMEQYAVQAVGKHFLDFMDVEYSLGWTQTEIDHQLYYFPFELGGLDYVLDWGQRTRPMMQPTNVRLGDDGSIERRLLRLGDMDHVIDLHVDNKISGNLDLTVPFGLGSLKFGGSAVLTHKDGAHSATEFRYIRPLTQFRFFMIQGGRFDVLDDYYMPWIVDAGKAVHFVNTNEPLMRVDDDLFRSRSEIWNYDVYENIYSGYGMATIELAGLTLIGGARLEYADLEYEGRRVIFNEFGSFSQATDTVRTGDNSHFFPHVQARYDLGNTQFRAAWSKSIARPDFNLLTPFERINRQDSTLYRGNPDLEAITSDNFDLMVSHAFSGSGAVSLGVFYKELTGFIGESSRKVSGGEYDNWNERTFVNSDDEVTLYGVELGWRQNLVFLPGYLKNLGIMANYTWIQSDYETEGREDVSYPGHSPHVFNTSLGYTHRRFSGQISYHWRGEELYRLQPTTMLAPSVDATREVYMDRYRDSYSYITAYLGFRISENFRLWADAVNIGGASERYSFDHSRTFYPREIQRSGYGFRAGIQFSL